MIDRLAALVSAPTTVTSSGVTPIDPKTTAFNWYDASTIGAADGSTVTVFPDTATGTPNSFVSGVSTYRTNAQNGKSVIELNGTSNGWSLPGGSDSSTFPYTIIAICKPTSLAQVNTILGVAANNGGLQFRINTPTGFPAAFSSGVSSIATGTVAVSTTNYNLLVLRISSSAYDFRVNQANAGSGSHSTSLVASRIFSCCLNSAGGTDSQWFGGRVGVIGIWHSYESDANILAYEAFLASAWGL